MSILTELAQRIGWLERWVTEHRAYEPTASTCQVYISTPQAIPTGTPTVVTFDSEAYDPDDLHSTVSNTGRITVKVAGVYTVSAWVVWDVHDTGTRRCRITVNGTDVAGQTVNMDGATIDVDACCSREVLLAVGDIVRLAAYQTSGGDLNLTTATFGVTRES